MKFKSVVVAFLLVLAVAMQATAQKKATLKQKPPTTAEMDKMMAEAMKGMSAEEKSEMKKMMKDIMPAVNTQFSEMAYYPDFNTNKDLVPKKDAAGIVSMLKKKLAQQDIGAYSGNLYNKMMSRGDADEIALIKSVLSKISTANDIAGTAVLAMMQGHPQAAMALSMKAVQLEPSNVNSQNNMAALLTQYGYPEQAMPVLEKLKAEFPYNSTVLNNIGQAWFSLGDLDSAKKYFTGAFRINPYHPEAKTGDGIIEEENGDTKKAEEIYIEAMENSPNPFTEKILKNKAGDKAFQKIDFEKLKRSIAIYEYFPKDWIEVPALSDNVSGYENDVKIQNGYEKMLIELQDKIDVAQKAAGAEVDALMNNDKTEFVKQMQVASTKGINKMSLTAVTVQKILTIYMAQWMQDNIKEYMSLTNTINEKHTEMTKSGDNDKCPDFDRKNNEFLAYANPLIREFHAKKIETFRNWLNAYCTWIWYLTGNPKNTVMTMCISWTGALVELYKTSIQDQRAIAKSCVEQNEDGSHFVPTPEIPNFTCPTLVKVPIGKDWQDLNNSLNNFNANSLGIKNNPAKPVPNQTSALGGGNKEIAQPGKAPFAQSANGSVSTGMINDTDDELVPLSKIPLDELTPLSKIPLDELTPLSKIPLSPPPDLHRSKFLRDLLKKMMTADCKNVKSPKDQLKEQLDRMMKGVKELDAYQELQEKLNNFKDAVDKMDMEADKKNQLSEQIKKMQEASDAMDKYEEVQNSKEKIEALNKEMDAMDEKHFFQQKMDKIMELVNEIEASPAIAKDIQQNGIQASISSGVQVPGTFTPQKGLFQ